MGTSLAFDNYIFLVFVFMLISKSASFEISFCGTEKVVIPDLKLGTCLGLIWMNFCDDFLDEF